MLPLGMVLPAWWKYAAIALLVASVWGHGWLTGRRQVHEAWDAATAKAEAAQLAEVQRLARMAAQVETVYVDRVRTVTKVVRNAESQAAVLADTHPLSPDWVRLYNLAAAGIAAEPPGGADGAPGGAGTVAD